MGVYYQSFWTLTASPDVLQDARFRAIAVANGLSPSQLLFRFCMQQGIVPLTGTHSLDHMRQDLAMLEAPALSEEHMKAIDRLLHE